MGQVALGLRSLVVKALVFFLMAALLVWALGGTLFPRPEHAVLDTAAFGGKRWTLRLSVGGDHPGVVRYQLLAAPEADRPEPVLGPFADAAGLVVNADRLYAAVRTLPEEGGNWTLISFDEKGTIDRQPLPDRLAIEQALALLRGSVTTESAD